MVAKTPKKHKKASVRYEVTDNFVYRGVLIRRFLKPTKRTWKIDQAALKIMKDRLGAGPAE